MPRADVVQITICDAYSTVVGFLLEFSLWRPTEAGLALDFEGLLVVLDGDRTATEIASDSRVLAVVIDVGRPTHQDEIFDTWQREETRFHIP